MVTQVTYVEEPTYATKCALTKVAKVFFQSMPLKAAQRVPAKHLGHGSAIR
jgi:hypothetical protein